MVTHCRHLVYVALLRRYGLTGPSVRHAWCRHRANMLVDADPAISNTIRRVFLIENAHKLSPDDEISGRSCPKISPDSGD